MNIFLLIKFLLIIIIFIFSIKRHLTYLHMFQQQEYYNTRFLGWIIQNKAFDKRLSGLIIGLLFIFMINNYIFYNNIYNNNYIYLIIIMISLLWASYFEKNPLKIAKKKLIITNRAKRIYFLSLTISLIFNLIIINILFINLNNINYLNINLSIFLFLLLDIQLIPGYLVLANLLLNPIEQHFQQKFWHQANHKIITNKPYIIGITGSFGKTSVKYFLGHILQYLDHTLITPGSVNTSMGISRIIREQLNHTHKYFIVEMGAYGIGSIKNLCKLTVPNMGIITNIGNAHYERFKTLETVAKAKFELADATIYNKHHNNQHNKNSKIIISDQTLNTNYAKQYLKTHNNNFAILNNQQISSITQLTTGLAITLNWQATNYNLEVPIFGMHQASNIALAFIAALELGMPPNNIITAFKTMPQITHRLEVIKQHNCTVIDDAYNSNPIGFRSALELLNFLHVPSGRRILVTPGLIELGKMHYAEHLSLGQAAANYADLVIVVRPQRIPSFVDGFKQHATNQQLILGVNSFEQAKDWLNQHCQAQDVVLLANDLPDLYETGVKI